MSRKSNLWRDKFIQKCLRPVDNPMGQNPKDRWSTSDPSGVKDAITPKQKQNKDNKIISKGLSEKGDKRVNRAMDRAKNILRSYGKN